MRAVVLSGYGDENKIQFREMPVPVIKDFEILVEVYAAAINPVDIKILKKQMWPIIRFKFPLILGTDLSGKVIKIGSKVTKFKVGDEVFASISTYQLGAFAEMVAIREMDASLKPENLNFEEAASIPLVGLTVYQALKSTAKLSKDQKVFIKAGSGGIGTFAIQFAKTLGAEVATTTSSKNTDWVKALGADHVIDYHAQKFEDVLKNYDVVLDSVDGDDISRGFKILKKGGHLLSIIGPPNSEFAKRLNIGFPLSFVMSLIGRKVTNLAKKYGVRFTFVFVEPSGAQLNEIKVLIEDGKIKPVIDRVFPIEKVREAFTYVAQGRSKGKVILNLTKDIL